MLLPTPPSSLSLFMCIHPRLHTKDHQQHCNDTLQIYQRLLVWEALFFWWPKSIIKLTMILTRTRIIEKGHSSKGEPATARLNKLFNVGYFEHKNANPWPERFDTFAMVAISGNAVGKNSPIFCPARIAWLQSRPRGFILTTFLPWNVNLCQWGVLWNPLDWRLSSDVPFARVNPSEDRKTTQGIHVKKNY